jgi:hypothetical protein
MVKERVELCLFFSSGPSWPVIGWIYVLIMSGEADVTLF